LDIIGDEGGRLDVVDRHPEEALHLHVVQVHCEDMT
jgi:hypothetical protein